MVAQFRLSRRYLLGVTAAVGGLAVSGEIVRGQSTSRIEKLAPELDKIISTSERVQYLADSRYGLAPFWRLVDSAQAMRDSVGLLDSSGHRFCSGPAFYR